MARTVAKGPDIRPRFWPVAPEAAARLVREEKERARAEYFAYMEEYQAEFGAFTDEERARARRELGYEDPE